MAEKAKKLSTEEICVTAFAVIGGLAVLIPILLSALESQGGGRDSGEPAVPEQVVVPDRGEGGGTAPQPGEVERPAIPSDAESLKQELIAARGQLDVLGAELEAAKTAAEKNRRSAERAWKQLGEAAGELSKENGEDEETGPGKEGAG